MPTTAELEADLATAKELLTAVNDAIKVVLKGGQSYSLDSGQTRTSVNRSTLGELRKQRSELQAEIQDLQSQLRGTTGFVGRPAW